ncbi:sigma factor-like helix-turn-helix DNA-binding protein [Paenibacillus riograndensis]|uniref:ECF family RNA polymerase sigma factor n=1 Tax=Paenibacillus riograndensis SBR5 TaxID=1073571 RepID=A0A0E4CWU3_9BACL|nr:sigma factor-like helix-turn-helix DNA-binding protein [Paenibacillus riograndensis]CQR55649.1 ECF family RNA polymerase sigma factor [Paenibacillus riograndensis SBR5]
MGGWLKTVVSRVCLDMLRSRKSRREEPFTPHVSELVSSGGDVSDPECEALLADSVGLAMLVVLGSLNPAEQIAFVLHDVFALPFEEIAPIVGRSKEAARQLARRARRRVHGFDTARHADLARQRELVDAFLAATRAGNFDALLKVLDPDVVLRDDRRAASGAAQEIHGVQAVSGQVVAGGARAARPILIDGDVGIVVAPRGELQFVIKVAITDGKIAGFHIISDKERIREMDLAALSAGD